MSSRDQYSKEVLQEEKITSESQVPPASDLIRHPTADKKITKQVAIVTWEDITAYSRVEIPEDFELFRLSKITVGILWRESADYIVLVQDYDLSNRGKGYRHNDFHIIPRGTIKGIKILGEIQL